MKRFFLFLILAILVFAGFILVKTFTFESRQLAVNEEAKVVQTKLASAGNNSGIEHLREAIRFETISFEDPEDFDPQPFLDFHAYLDATYPLVKDHLNKETISQYSLLYRWEGSNDALKPIVLTGHMDVVPIEKDSRSDWKHDPFAGDADETFIWGRGTVDDKITVIGLLESVEKLISEGYQPERTVYLAFGHDEEIGGEKGAKQIAALLKSRGVEAEFVMDEGGLISQKLVPGIDKDVALIGTAEKGDMSIELSVNKTGGHSSMPEPETPIDILASAITKLKENPPAARISKPVKGFFEFLGPEMPFVNKMAFANADNVLFEKMIIDIYEKSPSGNATVKTTFVPTVFNSGIKSNLIPSQAKVIINFRILPGETTDEVMAYVKNELEGMPVKIKALGEPANPTTSSPTDSFGFKTIQKTITEVYPQALVSPYLMVGATDAKQYEVISKNIYRFLPAYFDSESLKLLHGVNERISKEHFLQSMDFYYRLIKNSTSKDNTEAVKV